MSDFLDRVSKLPPKRLALLALELQSKLERAERRQHEPIAVIGVGCRFPAAADPDEFWRLLHEGVDAMREVPPDRWDVNAWYDPRPGVSGKMITRSGGFLDQIDHFDPHFFGIAPREAAAMDPQQRLLLEVAWEALERAGVPADCLGGSSTAVFVGISSFDFAQLLVGAESSALDVYTASGASHAIASGRLSYTLGLQGASVSLDTACSSSLVAMHLACQSLRTGESRMALAAGINLMISPETTISLSKAAMLAPDGRCKTFDAAADGFARGEGCGVVVLKRLSDAQADGDRIMAVIRGSAVNQDGRSSGITAPNGPAQEAVIREALEKAGIKGADVDFVEAHGTGTVLGDPIEVRALGAVLGAGRDAHQPLLIGSVKTNFGHLEAAAGIAGVIKTVLALDREEIPPHLHFTQPNPHIEWDRLPIAVTATATPWPRSSRRRVAGVSSFGFSGTNAHVILEEAPTATVGVAAAVERPLHILTLSAKTEPALAELARRHAKVFSNGEPAPAVADVCFSANTGRATFPHRLAVIGASSADFQRKLSAFADAGASPEVLTGAAVSADPPEVAFLFTGQGSQYVGMGRELFTTQPVFRSAMERCDEVLRPYLEESLLDILYPGPGTEAGAESRLVDTRITQPALFAIEYALAELWHSWGVTPTAVAGHSLGEYVAACVAGAIGFEDALRLVAERARLMSELPAGGAMAAVFADEASVGAAIAAHSSGLAIAAVNGPAHVVVSGEEQPLTAVLSKLAAEGVRSTRLNVSHAFHSPLMEPMLPKLREEAAAVASSTPRIGLVSNLTGSLFSNGHGPDAAYWSCHARQPVRFAAGLRSLHDLGCSIFIEIGPHPVLLGMGREDLSSNTNLKWLPSLRRGRGDWQQILTSVGALWTAGGTVDWRQFDREYQRRKVVLPTYPFQRQRYWPSIGPPAARAAERGTDWREWLYEPQWTLSSGDAAAGRCDFIPPPEDIAARVQPLARPLAEQHGVAVYDQLYALVDRTCSAYMVDALRRLGWEPRIGDRLEVDELRRRLGILERHRPLMKRILEVFAEDGLLEADGSGWRVARVPERDDPRALMEDLRRRFPQCEGELSLTARCADQLAAVLRGDCDPMQLLFPAGSLAQAEALYQHAPAFRVFNTLVAEACSRAVANRPDGRTAQILEIGAGTGGTTAYVLPALGRGVRYVFTDVSGLFTARAREKFKAFDFVDYRTLDIERDPAEQGFPSATFDMVIASNVLHATADLRATLHRVRGLLAPGGLLVLLEGTRPERFGDLTVGLTEGWWRFNDDLRPSYALMPADRWMRALTESGFEQPIAFPGRGVSEHAVFDTQSVILARVPQRTAAIVTRGAAPQPPAVVLCQDNGDESNRLIDLLRASGRRTIQVVQRESWAAIDEQTYALDCERVEDLTQLFGVVGPALQGATIIHMRGVSDQPAEESTEAVVARLRRGCRSALAVVQAIAALPVARLLRLLLVTKGAQAVASADAPVDAAQSALWGFGRVVQLEHPELGTRMVDFGVDECDLGSVGAIIAEDGAQEMQIAVRGQARYVLKVAPIEGRHAVHEPRTFEAAGTYLITGGLNGLGLALAEWMVARGAKHVVLMGRNAPVDRASSAIDRLRAAGADVVVALGDVSSRSSLEAVLARIDPTVPLRGVMHCAGATDDASVAQMTWEKFERVMAAKVRGSWHLHQLTASAALDHFVLFSSGAALLGSRGQSNHAAANAFMDALAHHRRARGLPALSINWGPWSEIGAATRGGILERMQKQGVQAIDPASGFAALDHLLGADIGQAAVFPIASPKPVAARPEAAAAPLLASAVAQEQGDRAAFRHELDAASREARRALLLGRVRADASAVLGFSPDTALQTSVPLGALGLDSLMSLELKNRMEAALAIQLPLRLFVDSTVDHLVAELCTYVEASSIEQLEERLSNPEAPQAWRSLVAIQGRGGKRPLFIVPGVSGNVVGYEAVADALGPDQPVYGLQSVGLDGARAPLTSVEEIAAHFLEEIRSVQAHGPYHIAGACMGGAVAFEIARRMRTSGDDVALLALIDSWLNNDRVRAALFKYTRPLQMNVRRARKFIARLRATPRERRREYIAAKLDGILNTVRREKPPEDESRRIRVRVSRANAAAFMQYTAKPYDGHVTLLLASGRTVPSPDPRLDWSKIATGFTVYRLPGRNSGLLIQGESGVRVAKCLIASGLGRE